MTRKDDQPIDQIRKQLGGTGDVRLDRRIDALTIPRVTQSFALPDMLSNGDIRDMLTGHQLDIASMGNDLVTLVRRLGHTELMMHQNNAALREQMMRLGVAINAIEQRLAHIAPIIAELEKFVTIPPPKDSA